MDPVIALSVASATVQLVQFGLEALSLCREIRDDAQGASGKNRELETYSGHLKDLSQEIQAGTVSTTKAGRRISKIAQDCLKSANDLEALLRDVRKAGNSKLASTVKTLFKTMRERRTIEKLANSLKEQRKLLDSALVQDISNRVDLVPIQQSKEFSSLKPLVQDLVQQLRDQQAAADKTHKQAQKDLKTIQAQNERLSHASAAAHSKTHQKLDVFHSEMDSNFSKLHVRDAKEEILQSLFYPDHAARRETVKPPAERTYEWVFNRPQAPASDWPQGWVPKWSNFSEWLECNDPVYWISGKAGSGKSTLMAHIICNEQTRRGLETWASGRALYLPSFFFWRPGSPLQKSIQGLLRSLAYQLLEEVPGLAETILQQASLPRGRIDTWTERRLGQIIKHALEASSEHRFCLFIDGLDEFEGDYNELLDIVLDLQSLPHVKLCTSSRPESVLARRMRAFARLKMEDLNYNDIRIFVLDKLEPFSQAADISRKIVNKAEGVFLWAALTTQSILRGVQSGDDLDLLDQRLEQIPKGLNAMFKQMLQDVDPVYKKSLGHFLGMMREGNLTPLNVAASLLADKDITSYNALWTKCAQIENQIVSQSRGLLLIRKIVSPVYTCDQFCCVWSIPDSALASGVFCDRAAAVSARTPSSDHGNLTQYVSWELQEVQWVHRSAYDFIFVDEAESVSEILDIPSETEVRHFTLQAYMRLLILGPHHPASNPVTRERLADLLINIRDKETILSTAFGALLVEIRALVNCFDVSEFRSRPITRRPINVVDDMMALLSIRVDGDFWYSCIRFGLWAYVQENLGEISAREDGRALLVAICSIFYQREWAHTLRSPPQTIRTFVISLISQVRQVLQSELRTNTPECMPATTTEIENDYGRYGPRVTVIWHCCGGVPMDREEQELNLTALCIAWAWFVYEGFFGEVTTDNASHSMLDSSTILEVAASFRECFDLWKAELTLHVYTYVLMDPNPSKRGIVSWEVQFNACPSPTVQYSHLAGQLNAMTSSAHEEIGLMIRYQYHSRFLTKKSGWRIINRDHHSGKCKECVVKSVIAMDIRLPTACAYWFRASRDKLGGFVNGDFRSEVANLVISDIWENREGRLDAWQQLCAIACMRIYKRRYERGYRSWAV